MKHIGTSMFETERLLCRRFEENDLDDIFIDLVATDEGYPIY